MPLDLPAGLTEAETLTRMQEHLKDNKVPLAFWDAWSAQHPSGIPEVMEVGRDQETIDDDAAPLDGRPVRKSRRGSVDTKPRVDL
jgi:hypothetical protein